jgi:hypothetical protein
MTAGEVQQQFTAMLCSVFKRVMLNMIFFISLLVYSLKLPTYHWDFMSTENIFKDICGWYP